MSDPVTLDPQEFLRLINNFYIAKGLAVDINRMALDSHLVVYFNEHAKDMKKKSKIALCCVCVNPEYWEYAKQMLDGVKQFFLPGHKVDVFFWSDMPKPDNEEAFQKAEEKMVNFTKQLIVDQQQGQISPQQIADVVAKSRETMIRAREGVRRAHEATVFPIEPVGWPMPTLMRYHLYLQQEENLKEYDYIFHCDVDMLFVNVVGDEILGQGLTAAQHPMYALSKEMWPPYEPNPESTAYIKRPGMVINDEGRPRFMPLYFAGGFQGGKSELFIQAMKAMRKTIDADFAKNYIAIWNDETHWNRYLFENLKPERDKILTPSYIYPDSLIKEYYEPRWGQSYQPKLVTLTKKHTLKQLTPEEQAQVVRMKK